LAPFILSVSLLAACCSVEAATGTVSSERMARVQHACAVTMGLDPSEQEFASCKEVLLTTLADVDREREDDAIRAACLDRGHAIGTPGFSLCVVDTEQGKNPRLVASH
jgi:hypothetical protein